jgi:hypothetical protein
MSHVIAEIIDKALSCKAPCKLLLWYYAYWRITLTSHLPAYNTILDLDALLTKTEAECIPEGFKNPSLSDLAEKPYLRGAYTEIQIREFRHSQQRTGNGALTSVSLL